MLVSGHLTPPTGLLADSKLRVGDPSSFCALFQESTVFVGFQKAPDLEYQDDQNGWSATEAIQPARVPVELHGVDGPDHGACDGIYNFDE
jgi:hypothetical protein